MHLLINLAAINNSVLKITAGKAPIINLLNAFSPCDSIASGPKPSLKYHEEKTPIIRTKMDKDYIILAMKFFII